MYRNRSTTDPASTPSTVVSVSSTVPLMATSKDDNIHSSSQSFTSTTTKIHNVDTNTKHTSTIKETVQNRDSKRGRTICQPKGTIPYTVGNNDTLEKIALHFNSTPSTLMQLNKLNTRMVFPGQILYVPEGSSSGINIEQKSSDPLPIVPATSLKTNKDDDIFILTDRHSWNEQSPTLTQEVGPMVWSMTRQSSAKPGHAQRLKSDDSAENEAPVQNIEYRLKAQKKDSVRQVKQLRKSLSVEENQQLDEECLQRFIKLNVRLVTDDRKNVAGTLLVTPNAVMFDPDVLDPLVKENGIDKYGLIIRMDLLAGIALYEDIAMYELEATLRDEEKRKMFHSTSIKNIHQTTMITSSTDEEQINEIMSTLLDKIDRDIDFSDDLCCVLYDAAADIQRRKSSDHRLSNDLDLFQTPDDYKHSVGILVDDKDISSQTSHLENRMPANQLNERFNEIDKLLQKQHEIYVEPHPIEIPYYLCIKTSVLFNEMRSIQEKLNRKSIDYVYGKKDLEYEYWFSVPKERVDHLYAFFLRWSPERATDSTIDEDPPDNNASTHQSNTQSKHKQPSSGQGFVLLANDDPELSDDYLYSENANNNSSKTSTSMKAYDIGALARKPHYLKRQNTLLKEWEIISVDEIYRRINAANLNNNTHTPDFGVPAPKLLQPTTLIDELQSKQILLELPARVHGLNWRMLFSTDANGFSLNQLYRRSMEVDQDSPALLIVKDIEQHIFGAYISQQLMVSEGFYGTGETFLFTFHPQFRVFHWTGNNQFFVKGDVKSLGIGCGEGTFGLWLDADLYHGRTCPSKTFNNIRLSSKEDFIIASIEVWTFID